MACPLAKGARRPPRTSPFGTSAIPIQYRIKLELPNDLGARYAWNQKHSTVAMRSLKNAPLANLNDPITHAALSALDPDTLDKVHHKDFVVVSIDASHAFNRCLRQRFLNTLPERAPTRARFCNLIYAITSPPLIIRSSPPQLILSRDWAQHGDPPSMFLFSLAMQELLRELVQKCNLLLTLTYDDDISLAGPVAEIIKVIRILHANGPAINITLT